MSYATIKKMRDGRVLIRGKGPRGVEICVIAPREWLAVGDMGDYPAVGAIDEIGLEVQGFFDNIGKAFSKVIKNKWVKTAVAGALSLYGVPPGVTTKAMEASGNLVDAARGDPNALNRIKRIATEAIGGRPAAQTAMKALKAANVAHKRAGETVSLVSEAIDGNTRARAKLETIAQRAQRNPNDRAAQIAATAIRTTVAVIQRPPPPAIQRTTVRPRLAQPSNLPGTDPRVVVTRDSLGRKVVTVTV